MDEEMSKRSYPEPALERKPKSVKLDHQQEVRCLHRTDLRKKFFEDMEYVKIFGKKQMNEVPCGFIYYQVQVAKVNASYFKKSMLNVNLLGSSTNYSVAGFVTQALKLAQTRYPCPYARVGSDEEEHACSQTSQMLEILGTVAFDRMTKDAKTALRLMALEAKAKANAAQNSDTIKNLRKSEIPAVNALLFETLKRYHSNGAEREDGTTEKTMVVIRQHSLCFMSVSLFARQSYLAEAENTFQKIAKSRYDRTWLSLRSPPIWAADLPNADPVCSVLCPYCFKPIVIKIDWRTGEHTDKARAVRTNNLIKHTVKHLTVHKADAAISLYNRIYMAIRRQPPVDPNDIPVADLPNAILKAAGPLDATFRRQTAAMAAHAAAAATDVEPAHLTTF